MSKATLAVKVDYKTVNKVKKFCRERGIKYGFFVERALEERLEREELKEDLLDLKTLRSMEKEAISIEDYLKKRRV
jgi:arsenate reductase-like glutaredoxin family protein